MVEQSKTVAPLMSMIPVAIVDSTGRMKAEIGTDEDAEGRLYYQLSQTMSFYDPYLHLVLGKIKEQFALSADDLNSFMYECPIFLESRKPILKEGLIAYMGRDFLKAIHVLIPQVEEMLRNFLVLIGIPPVKSVNRHPGITDMKSMNNGSRRRTGQRGSAGGCLALSHIALYRAQGLEPAERCGPRSDPARGFQREHR
jgi:hypothetical protein